MQPVARPENLTHGHGKKAVTRRHDRSQRITIGGHNRRQLLKRLQLLARLEAHGLSRRDRDFGAGARVPSNTGLTGADIEYAEAAKLDSLTPAESSLHTLEHSLDGHLRFGLGDARLIDHFVND